MLINQTLINLFTFHRIELKFGFSRKIEGVVKMPGLMAGKAEVQMKVAMGNWE